MISALVGGAMIGAAAVWLMASLGRVAGISGIVSAALTQPRRSLWAVLFLVGLGIGGSVGLAYTGQPVMSGIEWVSLPLMVGGWLVGFGTRLGSGCTSGHGVCGIARLSPRSLVATGVFMLAACSTASALYWGGMR